MNKNKKKMMHSAKEEKQGKKVMVILGVAALILMGIMLLIGSLWG